MDIRNAAYGVIIRDGQVLLSHWNEHGRSGWSLPGGGIDGDERPVDAAIREIREETGYEAAIDKLLGLDHYVVPAEQRTAAGSAQPLYAMRIVFRAHVTGGVLTNEIGGSSDEARWFDLDEVPRLERVSLVDIGLELDRSEPADGVARLAV